VPHTILEYSDNLVEPADFQPLWARLHAVLVAEAQVRLQDIKSRAYGCEAFRMGAGEPGNTFVHLTVRLLEGRSPEVLGRVGRAVLEVMKEHFAASLGRGQCDLTVELVDMRRDGYFKAASGPRT